MTYSTRGSAALLADMVVMMVPTNACSGQPQTRAPRARTCARRHGQSGRGIGVIVSASMASKRRRSSRRSRSSRGIHRPRRHGDNGSRVVPVVFRVLKREWGGNVIALFSPVDAEDMCPSFAHASQHVRDHYGDAINQSRPARPEEYDALKRELEAPPHNYRLRVVQRLSKSAQ